MFVTASVDPDCNAELYTNTLIAEMHVTICCFFAANGPLLVNQTWACVEKLPEHAHMLPH